MITDLSLMEDGIISWATDMIATNGGATFLIVSSITIMAAATRRIVDPYGSRIRMTWEKLRNPQIAWRAAQDIQDNAYVNLGIGIPELIAKFQPEGRHITYHTENGVLGFGAAPAEGEEDWDLIAIGKYPNSKAVIDLFADDDYQAAYAHRAAACETQRVMLVQN